MRLYRRLAAVAVGLLAGPMLIVGTAHAAPVNEGEAWRPTLLSSERLYDGSAVRLRYTDGITVVASAGAKVVFTGSEASTTTADRRRVYDRAVRILEPVRRSLAAAEEYAEAGRSVYADALAAGFSPAEAREQAQPEGDFSAMEEPPIRSSGCIYSEDHYPDPEYEWSGCYKLYDVSDSDSTAWYAAGSGTARGWGTGVLGGGKELQRGYSQLSWDDRAGTAEVIEASPPSNQTGTACDMFTIGLSHIFAISYQVPLCDDGWDVTWPSDLHKVEWHGASTGGESDLRHASGATTVRVPLTSPTVYVSYEIGWTVACFFC